MLIPNSFNSSSTLPNIISLVRNAPRLGGKSSAAMSRGIAASGLDGEQSLPIVARVIDEIGDDNGDESGVD